MSLLTLLRPDQKASRARVRTSSCRGYIVELDPDSEAAPRMLENLHGNVVHFRSLDRVRDALKQRGVSQAVLLQRHACEELGALGVSSRREAGVPLLNGAFE